MTQDDGTEDPGPDRAADVRAMTSNANWEARLEEARRKREEVLAAKGKPMATPPPLGGELKIHQIDGPAAELIDEAALAPKPKSAPPQEQPKPRLAALVPHPAPPPEPPIQSPDAAEVLEFNRPGQPAPKAAPTPPLGPLHLPRSAEVRDPPLSPSAAAPQPAQPTPSAKPEPTPKPVAPPADTAAPAQPTPAAPAPDPAPPLAAPPPLSAWPETLSPTPPMRPVGPARPQDAMTGPDGSRLHLQYAARQDRRRRNRRLAFVLGAAFGAGMGVAVAFMPPGTLEVLAARLGTLVQSAAALIPTGA